MGKLKKANIGPDEKNHGERFLIGLGFKGEKKIGLKFPFKMAIAVHYGRKADGDLEGESVSCLKGPLNSVCEPWESDLGKAAKATAGRHNR